MSPSMNQPLNVTSKPRMKLLKRVFFLLPIILVGNVLIFYVNNYITNILETKRMKPSECVILELWKCHPQLSLLSNLVEESLRTFAKKSLCTDNFTCTTTIKRPKTLYLWFATLFRGQQISGFSPSNYAKNSTLQFVKMGDLHLMSSYFDGRFSRNRSVVVILFGPRQHLHYLCDFFFENGDISTSIVKIDATFEKNSYIARCPLKNAGIAKAVSVRTLLDIEPKVWLPVTVVQREKKLLSLTICVATLHSNYSNWQNLIQFVESYRNLGVKLFTFYVLSASKVITDTVLAYYVHSKLAHVVHFPNCTSESYYCQISRINDCLYRNGPKSRFMLFVDVDEHMITPKYSLSQVIGTNFGFAEGFMGHGIKFGSFQVRTKFVVIPSEEYEQMLTYKWPDTELTDDQIDLLFPQMRKQNMSETSLYCYKSVIDPAHILTMAPHGPILVTSKLIRNAEMPQSVLIYHYKPETVYRKILGREKDTNLDYYALSSITKQEIPEQFKNALSKRIVQAMNEILKFSTLQREISEWEY